jgi:hypothetical protein
MKYLWYIVATVCIIALCTAAYFYGRKPPRSTVIIRPVETKIIYKQLPAVIINENGHEIATLDTTLVSADSTATIDMAIRYDETDNLFDINADITTQAKTVTITKKPPFVALTGGIGIGFQNGMELKNAQIDAGVRFVGKYDVTAFINTDKTFGIRFGIGF